MEKIIDEENKIEFDIQKFLDEDCKEENEIGIQMTSSILRKAFEKGLQSSALYCYEKGIKDAKTEFIAMLTELQQEIEELDTYDIERTHGLIEDGYVTTDISDIIQQKIDKLKENKGNE